MPLLDRFLDPATTSLKICGVTRECDAQALIGLGVEAIGINFWPSSKRFLDPCRADWLTSLAGRILRVGVFVNEDAALPIRLHREGLIDLIQLHGDESPADAAVFRDANIPFIKAIGVATRNDLAQASDYGARGILLDAHAPGVYGGTGECFDWDAAVQFKQEHPALPLLLAGGITTDNIRLAIETVHPAAVDVASGAESAPGIKDLKRVESLLAATRP